MFKVWYLPNHETYKGPKRYKFEEHGGVVKIYDVITTICNSEKEILFLVYADNEWKYIKSSDCIPYNGEE